MNNLEKIIDENIKIYKNNGICFEVNYDMNLVNDILKILEDRGYVWSSGSLPTKFKPLQHVDSLILSDDVITYSPEELECDEYHHVKHDELKEAKKKMNDLEKIINEAIERRTNNKIYFEVKEDVNLANDILKVLEDKGYMWSDGTLPTEYTPSKDIRSLCLMKNDEITYSIDKLDYIEYDKLKGAKKKKMKKKIDVNDGNVRNILILEPYTIVYFTDGDIFVACCDDEDEFNEEVGVAICKTKKMIKDEKNKLEKLKRKLEEEMKFSERRIKFGQDYLKDVNE